MTTQELPATSTVLLQTDMSKKLLDSIVGKGWDNWGQSIGGSASAELMLQFFSAFNLFALAIMSAMFIWFTVTSVIGTAHEDVVGGKKFDTKWSVLRFVGAMGALAPIFKGLSLFQIAILSCIGFSINMGNYTWNLGSNYFIKNGGQLTVQAPNQNISEYSTISNGIIKSLTLQYFLIDSYKQDIVPGATGKFTNSKNDEYVFTFNGDMGSIIISCPDKSTDGMNLCKGKINAVSDAITELFKTAIILADTQNNYYSILPNKNILLDVSNQINKNILDAMIVYSEGGQLAKKLQAFKDETQAYGWFIAGASYWSITWINQEVREAMYSNILYTGKKSKIIHNYFNNIDYKGIETRLINFINEGYITSNSSTIADASVTDGDSVLSSIGKTLRNFINSISLEIVLPQFTKMLTSKDPIIVLSNIGDYFITGGMTAFAAVAGIDAGNSLFKMIPFVGNGAASLDKYVSFFLYTIFIPFIAIGLIFAYFIPAIPFIYWTVAIFGWLKLVVEAMFAAPLWLCGHAMPDGDGAAGQHGKKGYMLLLAIIIRPPLMVAGFFSAVIILNVIGQILGTTFTFFTSALGQTKVIGPFGTICMIIILGIVLTIAINKFFSLIHYLPEHVTNWIGQQMHSLGEENDVSGAKMAYVGFSNKINNIASKGGASSKGQGSNRQDVKKPFNNNKISEKNLA